MNMVPRVCRLALQIVLVGFSATTLVAQPGHGGMPPGQAKKYGDDGMPPGQAKKYGEDGRAMPPGQAKKYGDWRFRDDDRDRFYSHYREDAERWRGRRRPVFVPGELIPRTYVVHIVPPSYWAGVPPPPPGYQYGYYDGYVVAYNPATRVIGDVLDLIGAATGR